MNPLHALAALLLASPAAAQYTLYTDLSVSVPETGNEELYNLAVPNPIPDDMPLIVVFHGQFSTNHHQVVIQSQAPNGWDLLTDATAAGFGVLMPRAGHPDDFPMQPSYGIFTYGRRIMHYHVAAAIAQVQSSLSIDPDRIYAYGFSMGGGDALSYVARHLDPTGVMFAAVLTHSGAVSPPYSYHHGGTTWQDYLEGFYQAVDYATEELKFQEASAVDYGPLLALRPDTSMGWNLTHLPVFNYYDDNGIPPHDNPGLVAQCHELDDLMANYVMHTSYTTANTTGDGHGYIVLDTATILGAFTSTLQLPKEAKTLVAEPLNGTDERVFHFRVTRRAPAGAPLMASFDWDVNWVPGPIKPFPPRLDLHDLDGLATVRGLTNKLGYSATRRLNVDVSIDDGQPVVVELTDYGAGVSQILANGVPLTAGVDYGFNGSILWINVPVDTLLEIFP